MIISTALQGSDDWLKERAGKVSASCFSKILTSTGARSSGETRKSYIYQLAGERISGVPEDSFKTDWMQRGNDLEDDARMAFEARHARFVVQVGMIYLDDRKVISCSPDGLVGDDKGLELKCPKLSTHIGYLDCGKLPSTYKQQVMGCLWISGRDAWHFASYHPSVDMFAIEVERDEKYINILAEAVEEFNSDVEKVIAKLR